MANIQIYDDAGTGLDLRSGGDWINVIGNLGTLTQFGSVAGPATINLSVVFNNGAFSGRLELEPEGNNVRLENFTIFEGTNDLAITGTDVNALVSLSSNIEDIQLLSDPFSGADTLAGNSFADFINGGGGNDSLFGNSGNDTLEGASGDDALNGGPGTDTAGYSGAQASYTLTLGPSGMTIEDRRAEGNGTDTLTGIEFLDFDTNLLGEPFDLTTFAGLSGLSGSDLETFIELYIAYFNRAPDAVGLSFWGTAFANGVTLEQSASYFIDQPETRATYPDTLSNADFASAVYDNVLGRVPDQAGFEFWVGALESGGVGRDQFILSVLEGAKAPPPQGATDDFIAQQLADQQYLATKTDIGGYFAVTYGMSSVENASAAMALFDGTSTGVNAAVAAIDGYYLDALDPASGEFLMPLVGVLDNPFAV